MRGKVRAYWRILREFRGYRPQHVTISGFHRWLNQFDPVDRPWLIELVDYVIYLDERTVQRSLVRQNQVLLDKLAQDGVTPDHVIYIQFHDPASSSAVMLNMLRDAAKLEKKGCRFVDGRNAIALQRAMDELEKGAIIYVDDFVGTGNQFCKERDSYSSPSLGVFAEFLLVPAICEEALEKLTRRGIRWQSEILHSKSQRPLHDECFLFPVVVRDRLRALARQQSRGHGLGYRDTASMVVLYRNSPNTTPMLLRGDYGQSPRTGLFPRFQDLPD